MSIVIFALLVMTVSLNLTNIFMRIHEKRETPTWLKVARQVIEVCASASFAIFVLFFVLTAMGSIG